MRGEERSFTEGWYYLFMTESQECTEALMSICTTGALESAKNMRREVAR